MLGVALMGCVDAIAASPVPPPEIRAILAHGPWPIPRTRDPSNRVSGKPEAIDFGERLFFDRRLSANGAVSCSFCHLPERNWTDGEPRARALALTDRNAPSLANVRYQRWFGWDGANDSLWSQSIRPVLDRREFGASAGHVGRLMRENRDLACRYAKVFGRPASAENDERVLIDTGKAIAAFLETVVTGRTAFDEFRDALARGDEQAMARYPQSARRGLAIFVGKGACDLCHTGPAFTDGDFHDDAVPVALDHDRIDPGRRGGIEKLLASPFDLLGAYNDDPVLASAAGTRGVADGSDHFGQFKTPSLRKLGQTAPYMHNGSLETLRDVMAHYSRTDRVHPDGKRTLKALHLSGGETEDLLAFLQTLQDSGPSYQRRDFPEDCR
jgi:cytochrome c peroxidase